MGLAIGSSVMPDDFARTASGWATARTFITASSFRYRVGATAAQRVTSAEPADREPRASPCSVALHRFDGVVRTGRQVATGRRPSPPGRLIQQKQVDEQPRPQARSV